MEASPAPQSQGWPFVSQPPFGLVLVLLVLVLLLLLPPPPPLLCLQQASP